MPFPTRAELRAAFAEAMTKQFNPTDPAAAAAAIYAAVTVVLPDEAALDCTAPHGLTFTGRRSATAFK